jgi:hypothetical protein
MPKSTASGVYAPPRSVQRLRGTGYSRGRPASWQLGDMEWRRRAEASFALTAARVGRPRDLESGRATVITGFGMEPREVSAQLQRVLVRDVEKKLLHGPSDPDGSRKLMTQIEERASQAEEPERATMFTQQTEEARWLTTLRTAPPRPWTR